MGLGSQFGAGICYALRAQIGEGFSLVVCLALNWLGDSMDGTLARVRRQERPRYGFYVDHMVDILGSVALMCGLGASGLLHWPVAMAMLVAFLLLSRRELYCYLFSWPVSAFAGDFWAHGGSHFAGDGRSGGDSQSVLNATWLQILLFDLWERLRQSR